MALVACKECKKEIYIDAAICPRCGVEKPGVSYEEERLLKDIQTWEKTESDYVDRFREYTRRFLWEIRFRKIVDKYVQLANHAQQKVRELKQELAELRARKNA